MKNDNYPHLRQFLRTLNSAQQTRFARKCGTSVNYLRKAMSKGSKMDVKLVERIVVNSGYVVPPIELRPDVDWSVFTDSEVIGAMVDPKRRHLLAPPVEAAAAPA